MNHKDMSQLNIIRQGKTIANSFFKKSSSSSESSSACVRFDEWDLMGFSYTHKLKYSKLETYLFLPFL